MKIPTALTEDRKVTFTVIRNTDGVKLFTPMLQPPFLVRAAMKHNKLLTKLVDECAKDLARRGQLIPPLFYYVEVTMPGYVFGNWYYTVNTDRPEH
jgi:hypothetical protein